MGDLPGGGKISIAKDVSNNGSVIVGEGIGVNTANGPEAFIWTAEGEMQRLTQILPPTTINSAAKAVSSDGQVIVGLIDHPMREAFRWTAAEGLVLMGDFPGGPLSSEATDLSANGTVIVGHGRPSEEVVEAFHWTAETGMVGLGHLPSPIEIPYSAASSVSADGSVIVGFSTSGTSFEAFRWTAASGMKGLGFLSEEIPTSHAFAITADGSMIGGTAGTVLAEVAVIWTEAEGMRTLWDVLLSLGVDPAADGWETFRYVARFSADGRYVVGTGRRNGRDEGFIAEIGGPQLSYVRVEGKIELSWPAGFRLELRTELNGGSWEPVAGDSPLRVEMGERHEFYRLVGVR